MSPCNLRWERFNDKSTNPTYTNNLTLCTLSVMYYDVLPIRINLSLRLLQLDKSAS